MKYSLFIDGEWQEAKSSKPVYAPYSKEWIADVPDAEEEEINDAVKAAERSLETLKKIPAHERADLLRNAARLIEENRETCARLIALEAAKPIQAARAEVARTIMTYRFSSEEARRLPTEHVNMDAAPGGEGKTAYVLREPLGVIGAITPFNFPMNLAAHKIGPAIAAGNAVVLKPAGQTPLSAYYVAELFDKAGAPKGVLNVISGSGSYIGSRLVKDERVQMITFTGSREVGKQISENAGLKKAALELGSNSAVIVDDEADIEKVAGKLVKGAFTFQGQVCISVQRVYVHKSKYRELLRQLKQAAEGLVHGNPLDEAVDISALIHEEEQSRVLNWIGEAVERGAKLVTGGKENKGIIEPTILTDTNKDMSVVCEEVFGPVAVVESYETFDEAIAYVNDSKYGLQTGVFTNRIDKGLQAAREIEAGSVLINEIPMFRVDHMPYGGVKESGSGREGVKYAIEEMTERKLVSFES